MNVVGGVQGRQGRVCDVMRNIGMSLREMVTERIQEGYRVQKISFDITHSEHMVYQSGNVFCSLGEWVSFVH